MKATKHPAQLNPCKANEYSFVLAAAKRALAVSLAALLPLSALLACTGCEQVDKVVYALDQVIPSKETPPPEEAVAPTVEALPATTGSIRKDLVFAAKVTPSQYISVYSKLTGRYVEVNFDVGDDVHEGDELFKLDEQDILREVENLDAQIATAQKNVDAAQQAVESVRGGSYQASVQQLQATADSAADQVSAAQVQVSIAERDIATCKDALDNATTLFNKTQALFDDGIVAQKELDDATFAKSQAQSAYDQALNKLSQAKVALATAQTAKSNADQALAIARQQVPQDNESQAGAALETAQAQRDALQVQRDAIESQLTDLAVTAPINGVVYTCSAKVSEYATQQAPAYVIIVLDKVYVEVHVSEMLINKIALDDEVGVHIAALGDGNGGQGQGQSQITGRVVSVSPAADTTNTYPVKVEIDNQDRAIKPGMFAEVSFASEKAEGAIVLPRNTVVSNAEENYVFVVGEGGTAVKTPVTLGVDSGKQIEITSGLRVGDLVVVAGQENLRDGMAIIVAAPAGEGGDAS